MIPLADLVLAPARFEKLVEDLSHPPVALTGRVVAGAAAWERTLDTATREDRRALLQLLEPALLTATPGARERLAHHADLGSPSPDADWIEWHLVVLGDRAFVPGILAALARAPAPVRFFGALQCCFVCVGRPSLAWFSSSVAVGPDGSLRDRMIALGPGADLETLCHELGHLWCSAFSRHDTEPRLAVTATGEVGLRTLARAEGWEHRIDDYIAREERIADALAVVWG